MAAQDDDSLVDAIRELIVQRSFAEHTVMVCRVISSRDTPRMMVTVQVAPKLWRRNGDVIEWSAIPRLVDVPVMELRWGPMGLSAQPERGDHGVLLVHERDIDEWLRGGGGRSDGTYEPRIALIRDVNDAMYLPALQPDSQAGARARPGPRTLFIGDNSGVRVAIKMNETSQAIDIEAGGAVTIKAASSVNIDTPGLLGGPYTVVGINAAGVCTHIGSNTGGPVTWAPNPAAGVPGAFIR